MLCSNHQVQKPVAVFYFLKKNNNLIFVFAWVVIDDIDLHFLTRGKLSSLTSFG